MAEVVPIETASLGDRSYLAHDGEIALVVDPQRDIDRVIALATDAGVRVTHVAETHVHNDCVTGGLALARAAAATAASWPGGSPGTRCPGAAGTPCAVRTGRSGRTGHP